MSDTAINLFDASQPETKVKAKEGVSITPAAEVKVREMIETEGKPGLGLRVSVTSGGCSGNNYGLYFDDNVDPNDNIIEAEGFNIYIDPSSYGLLNGSTIDFVDSLQGSGFKIENPNATGTCGCGSSFTT